MSLNSKTKGCNLHMYYAWDKDQPIGSQCHILQSFSQVSRWHTSASVYSLLYHCSFRCRNNSKNKRAKSTMKVFLNECALLAHWHRHISTLLICILGVCRHKCMIPGGINYTIIHFTCRSTHVRVCKYACASEPVRHTYLEKPANLATCYATTLYFADAFLYSCSSFYCTFISYDQHLCKNRNYSI